MSLKRNITL